MLSQLITPIILDPIEQFIVFSSCPARNLVIVPTHLFLLTAFYTAAKILFTFNTQIKMASAIQKDHNFIVYFNILLTNILTSWGKTNLIIKNRIYFTIIFFLFTGIAEANFIGLLPFTSTLTASFILTFSVALTCFVAINIIGIYKNKLKIVNLFLPTGLPLPIVVLLVPIEIISYFSRVLSLSIRLFANMFAGHALLKILISFVFTILTLDSLLNLSSIIVILVIILITLLELLIAGMQAYVFTILTLTYLNNVFESH